MPSERVQRQIDRLLDEAEQAMAKLEWQTVLQRSQAALALDAANADAQTYITAAERALGQRSASTPDPTPPVPAPTPGPSPLAPNPSPTAHPASFGQGRYAVKRFLGEGGKKKVYLAHDTLLDRDIAFALIKTEGLDDAGRVRITREAQAMGRLGSHPHIVTVFDLGNEPPGEGNQPFMVTELMGGGDVEGLLKKAPEHKLTLERAVRVAVETCRGLEFAHAKGIVHRDLKPGNVWLTGDGIAKIGDFGLAVATDRSRLTQMGMMVGTVSYMPPEQAMGGEVTPRADLYSLGAMLYEMVAGRPPFTGDDSIAIIGQHLNAAPVSPAWHRPDCPPALDALILRLLEKDPTKRPASAKDVREALENLTPGPFPAAGDGSKEGARESKAGLPPPSSEAAGRGQGVGSPLYRRAFVGREAELKQLHAAFDAALSGQAGLAMVAGEPGIGKTALTEQLATYAGLRGGRVLVGHCYEEGTQPYLPFVEALRSYVLARPPEALQKELGAGAADVARVVSEVRDRVKIETLPAGSAEDDRYRLFQAVAAFLRNASASQPLLLVLEDLHWADRGTIDLLLSLVRGLQSPDPTGRGARLLIAGTYRDVEVDRSHPLSNALGELRRSPTFSRVVLRGLTPDEVQRMMSAIAAQDVPWTMAEAVHRQTEGNPLFIQEVLRYIVEEGLIKREDGRWTAASADSLATRIPEGLRDVIGKRLSRLSPECNRVLAIAAVIGRDFLLDTLREVSAMPEDTVISALEEASKIGVLQEMTARHAGGIQYRFAHAFFRQTLYEELSGPRRLRVHQQVARALEKQFAARLDEHASELAEHFGLSTDPADLKKAIEYSERAARRAMAVYAYGDAVKHLERALEVQEVLDPGDKARRCDLLLALGEALIPAGEPKRAYEKVAEEAFGLAGQDKAQALAACRLAMQAMWVFGGPTMNTSTAMSTWAQRWDPLADGGSADRVRADIALVNVYDGGGRWLEGQEVLERAATGALRVGDPLLIAPLPYALNSHPSAALRDLAVACAKVIQNGAQIADIALWSSALAHSSAILLRSGDRAAAQELGDRLEALAERTKHPGAVVYPPQLRGTVALLDGRLEDVVSAGHEVFKIAGETTGSSQRGETLRIVNSARALVYLGRVSEVQAATATMNRPGLLAMRVIAAASAGDEMAVGGIESALASLSRHGDAGAGFALGFLEACIIVRQLKLLATLSEAARGLAVESINHPVLRVTPARLLGEAAALLGEYEKARAYYLQGLEAAAKIRFRPEIALMRLDLAELLLDHYPAERAEALGHLDFAIAEFGAMKMKPSLERALKRKGILKA